MKKSLLITVLCGTMLLSSCNLVPSLIPTLQPSDEVTPESTPDTTIEPTAIPSESITTEEPTIQPTTEPTIEPTIEPSLQVRVGLGYYGEFYKATTNYSLDFTTAMVVFDNDGVIVDVRLDMVQFKVNANEERNGLVLVNTNLDDKGYVKTKLEMGTNYGMKPISQIGIEYDKQIEAFADWTIGKTPAMIQQLIDPSSGHGVAAHPDLQSSCTVTCHNYVSAISSAYNNLTSESYEVGKNISTGVAMSAELVNNYGQPSFQIGFDLAGVVVEDGVVKASAIDCVIWETKILEDGNIELNTSCKYFDSEGNIVSKKALGDKYGMSMASPIGTEWYEQAEIIEAAAIGKTGEEIEKLVADEGDLVGATMTLNVYVQTLAKAARYSEMELIGPQ